MAEWKYRIKIKDCFVDDPNSLTEKEVIQIGQNIAERIRKFNQKLDVNSICYDDLDNIQDSFCHVETVDDIDLQLDQLYDICDENRIWVE